MKYRKNLGPKAIFFTPALKITNPNTIIRFLSFLTFIFLFAPSFLFATPAELPQGIELKFEEDKSFTRKYYLHLHDGLNPPFKEKAIRHLKYFLHIDQEEQKNGPKIYVAKYDLNDDGVKEYIIKIKWDRSRGLCPRSAMPSCITIEIYGPKFERRSWSYDAYGGKVFILHGKTNGYHNLTLSCSSASKKSKLLTFNKQYKKYDGFDSPSCH